MRRRDFIAGLGAAAWPLTAGAQQIVRRVGVWMGETEAKLLRDALAKLGWIEGRNLRLDVGLAGGEPDRLRANAAELVSLKPDVIVTSGPPGTKALQEQTQTIPIVFLTGDALANGLVKNVARPEANTTGVNSTFSSLGGKWVQLLKEAVPRLERVAYVYRAQIATMTGSVPAYFASITETALALGVEPTEMPFRNVANLVQAIDAFAAAPNGGVIIAPSGTVILTAYAEHRLPAIYENRNSVVSGGLMSYGANLDEHYRRVASIIDRILRGAKLNELPVEYPTEFELVINLKTAKAMNLTIPESFLLRADQLIE